MSRRAHTFYLSQEVSKKIDAHLQTADKRSRSDFIESAVNFYCGVLDTDGNREFLSEEIIRAMKSIVKDMEGRIFSHFRSQDISLSMLSVLFAANLTGMTDEEIQMMRKIAVQYVDENRRAKSFITAVKEERSAE